VCGKAGVACVGAVSVLGVFPSRGLARVVLGPDACVPFPSHQCRLAGQVPLEKQIDAVKKNRQMLLLEECLHSIQANFNSRFMALRNFKKGASSDRCASMFWLNVAHPCWVTVACP
jgi:hypothetical protein